MSEATHEHEWVLIDDATTTDFGMPWRTHRDTTEVCRCGDSRIRFYLDATLSFEMVLSVTIDEMPTGCVFQGKLGTVFADRGHYAGEVERFLARSEGR